MGVKIGRMVLGMCQTNCYFIYREGCNQVIFIDPADYGEHIYETLKKNGFTVGAILLTHGHFDHIWGCSKLRALSGAKVYALKEEEELLLSAQLNSSEVAGRACTVKVNELVKDGEILHFFDDLSCKVLATPGHTVGGCSYYFEEAGFVLCGDSLFQGSVGRTDLPTGSASQLIRSIKEKLMVLPEDTIVYPGHGEATTIGHEKKYNPFLGA